MTVLTAGLIKAAIPQVSDFTAAINMRLANIPDDEQVTIDILTDVTQADPVLAPYLALASALIPAIAWIIENNQSTNSGSQLGPFAGGGSGSGTFTSGKD